MKKINLALILLLTIISTSFADIELAGVYQGKNLYIQNPFIPNTKEFCVKDVFINDVKMMQDIRSSAFEIDLSYLSVNSPVTIKITHSKECTPKILNPQVIQVKSSFSFNSINITDNAVSWTARNEKTRGRYFIERFEFNHWRTVGEVYSQNKERYEGSVRHNSGPNTYRVKYIEDNGNTIYSDVLEYLSPAEPISFYPKRVSDILYLSREADFEILDKYGNVIKNGQKKEIDLSHLSSDVYYINVDNKTFKFFKK